MAVGLVVVEAIRQPDHRLHRQLLAQRRLDLFAIEVRVAVAVEQAFLGGDQGAFAIDMDGAAFQHEAIGAIALAVLDLEDLARHLVVAVPGEVEAAIEAAPGIEGPVHTAHFALVVDHEGRAGITDPGVVGADFHHADVRLVETRAGVLVLAGGDADGHRLEARDGLGHGGEGGLRRLAAEAPVVRALGPDHPGLAVGFPLGRHAEAVVARDAVQCVHRSTIVLKGAGANPLANSASPSGWPLNSSITTRGSRPAS
ncbi:hypothetical protein D3C78_565030 [compost metagenome]